MAKDGTKRAKKFGLKRKTVKAIQSVGKHKIETMFTLYPPRKFITMDFSRQSALASAASQSTFGPAEVFGLNNILEPHSNASGGSTAFRAQGFDQLAEAYNRFKVYGALVTVVFNNPAIDGIYCGVRIGASEDDSLLGTTTINSAMMKKWTWVKPLNDSGSQHVTYSKYWPIHKLEGLTKSQYNNDILHFTGTTGASSTLAAANPSYVPTCTIAVANSASAASTNISYTIRIKYFVQLFDRIAFASSTYTA